MYAILNTSNINRREHQVRSDLNIEHHALLDAFLHTALAAGAALAFCGLIAVVVCVFWNTH